MVATREVALEAAHCLHAGLALGFLALQIGAGLTWLQNSHATWLTPRRMRVATIGVIGAAFADSTVGLSGSTAAPHHAAAEIAPVVAHR